SAKASHILIAYAGTAGASTTERTKEEAKSLADSLLAVIKSDNEKMAVLAPEFSEDPGSKNKAGDLGWFTNGMMVPEFNDFVFEKPEGSLGVVETNFGFHVISVDEKTVPEKAVKIATLARQIQPSEQSLNEVYAKATDFSMASHEKSFNEVVKSQNLNSRPVEGIKVLDANLPGLGTEREIVKWAFENGNSVGDIERFDISSGGYAVVQLIGKNPKGLMPV